MSSTEKHQQCTAECQLFRAGKPEGFECQFNELQAISWNGRQVRNAQVGGNQMP